MDSEPREADQAVRLFRRPLTNFRRLLDDILLLAGAAVSLYVWGMILSGKPLSEVPRLLVDLIFIAGPTNPPLALTILVVMLWPWVIVAYRVRKWLGRHPVRNSNPDSEKDRA